MSKVKWQYTEERKLFGKTVVFQARTTRSEIIVRGKIKDSNPLLWIEVGMPKFLGLIGATDQCAIEAQEKDFLP